MTKITLIIPQGAAIKEVSRKVRGWANRKPIGIGWSIDRTKSSVEVSFYSGSEDQIRGCATRLQGILNRCAPEPEPKPTSTTVPPELMMAMEWGYKAAERGININKAIEEFSTLF